MSKMLWRGGVTMEHKFMEGQTYNWTCWFTGGYSVLRVSKVTANTVEFTEHRTELDGEHDVKSVYDIFTDKDGREYVVMCSYHEKEGRIYAE